MCAQALAIQEKLGLIVHAVETKVDTASFQIFLDGEGLLVEPGTLRYPFAEQAVAVNIGIRDFSRLPQIVVRTTWNRADSPVTSVATIREMRATPAPVFAVKLFKEPITAIEGDTATH